MKKAYKVLEIEAVDHPHNSKQRIRIKDSNHNPQDAEPMLMPFFNNRYWGVHRDSPLGIVDSLLIYLNKPFILMRAKELPCKEFAQHILSPEEVERALILYDYHYRKLLDRQNEFSPKRRAFLKARDSKLEGWFNLIKKECELQKLGYSLYKNIPLFRNYFVKYRHDTYLIPLICNDNKASMIYKSITQEVYRDKRKAIKEPKPHPVFIEVVSGMAYEDTIEMIEALRGKLFLDERTLEFIKGSIIRWKTKPITEKELL
jgi:hypothetical protein